MIDIFQKTRKPDNAFLRVKTMRQDAILGLLPKRAE